MLALWRRLLTREPLSYAEKWLLNQSSMSLEWLINNKEKLR
jgi:hypothetical protein